MITANSEYIKPGMVLRGKMPFPDGSFPEYPRFYLVSNVEKDKIYVYQVTKIRTDTQYLEQFGCRYKLGDINEPVLPFYEGTFVELETLAPIDPTYYKDLKVYALGCQLNKAELNKIKQKTLECHLIKDRVDIKPENMPDEFKNAVKAAEKRIQEISAEYEDPHNR